MNLLSFFVAYINRLFSLLVAAKKGKRAMWKKKQRVPHNEGTWRVSEWESKRIRRQRCDDKTCFAIPMYNVAADKNISTRFQVVGYIASFSLSLPFFHLVMAHTNWALRKFTLFYHAAHSYTHSTVVASMVQRLIVEATLNKLKMMINMLYTLFILFSLSHLINNIIVFTTELSGKKKIAKFCG